LSAVDEQLGAGSSSMQVVADPLTDARGDPAHRIDPAQVAQLLASVRARLADPEP
jgi:hypothetical protein